MNFPLLLLAAFLFLIPFLRTASSWRGGDFRPPPWSLPLMTGGFLALTVLLQQRGAALGRCPVTSAGEMFVFLAWSVVLLYLVVGQTYRLSLMGAFTGPLALGLTLLGLVLPASSHPALAPGATAARPDAWLEFHVAVSLIAYGAFGLACVAGVMYLLQDRQLKSRRPHPLLFQLPPLSHLALALDRLVLAGFLLLTLGLMAGALLPSTWSHPLKISLSTAVWLAYGLLLLSRLRHLSPRRAAVLAIAAFTLSLTSLWSIQFAT